MRRLAGFLRAVRRPYMRHEIAVLACGAGLALVLFLSAFWVLGKEPGIWEALISLLLGIALARLTLGEADQGES